MQKMMAEIKNINSNDDWTTIEGKVSLDVSKEYSSDVSSYTQGLGVFITKSDGYQIVKDKYSNNINSEGKDKLLFMFEKSSS